MSAIIGVVESGKSTIYGVNRLKVADKKEIYIEEKSGNSNKTLQINLEDTNKVHNKRAYFSTTARGTKTFKGGKKIEEEMKNLRECFIFQVFHC